MTPRDNVKAAIRPVGGIFTRMKNKIAAIPALIGTLLVIVFLFWAFSQHGTAGLFRVTGPVRWIFLIFGFLGLILLLLALVFQRIKTKVWRWLMVLTIILSLPAIIIPPVAYSYTSGIFSSGIGDTPPQLLMADGTGSHGIPDMAVVFNSKETARNTLYLGLGTIVAQFKEGKSSNRHVFKLSNLLPDSKYYYQVNSGSHIPFTTPSTNGTLHFAVGSDAHYGAATARNDFSTAMLYGIASPANKFDMFFFLGDLVEYGFQENQWQQAFNAFSNTTSIVPTRFAAGNHDTLFSGFNNYKNYCYPEGMSIQTGSRLWYRIDAGKVHFLILDLEWSAESFTAAQAAWLETQLKSIPVNDWKIVMSHGFYYASGLKMEGWNWYDNPETIEKLTPLFKQYGVDLVFSGHMHRLELLQNSGVVYVVCAPFGGQPDPPATYKSASSIWDGTGQRGFVDVTLTGEQCTLVFRNPQYEALKTYVFNRN
jgi:UDP-2,3-diacylglucosamine pyrophosphatase LpxH